MVRSAKMRMVPPVVRVAATARGVINWLRQKIVTLRRVFDEKQKYFELFHLGMSGSLESHLKTA